MGETSNPINIMQLGNQNKNLNNIKFTFYDKIIAFQMALLLKKLNLNLVLRYFEMIKRLP